MSVQTSTLRMLEAVNAIVSKARRLHNGIPETVVVLGASGATRGGQKHGHFAPKSWRNRVVDSGEGGDGNGEVYGEILLAGESLERGAVGTLGTILHELAHAYCDANNIKDTSNNGRYHNTKFKDVAEEFGLDIEKHGTIGWSLTEVPETTQDDYREEINALESAIKVHRVAFGELLGKETKKPKVRKMMCPQCQEPVAVTKKFWEATGAYLKCSQHDEYMDMFEEGGK